MFQTKVIKGNKTLFYVQ